MRSRVVVAVAIAGALASAAAPAPARPTWTWGALHRPLHIPGIRPSDRCPVTVRHPVDLGAAGIHRLPGSGPAYPDFGRENALYFVNPPLPAQRTLYGSDWGGRSIRWWVRASYRGPVLVRGEALDGASEVRFGAGRHPAAELRIEPGAGAASQAHARALYAYTRLREGGCYAYQLDGVGFSRVIVFEALAAPLDNP